MAKKKKVKPDAISGVIAEMLDEYGAEIAQDIKDAIKETADEARDEIEKNTLSEFNGTGDYAKSWDVMENPSTAHSRLRVGFLVFSQAPFYRLAHLLENSHLMRNGQRWTNNKPIIANAENKAEQSIVQKIKNKVESD